MFFLRCDRILEFNKISDFRFLISDRCQSLILNHDSKITNHLFKLAFVVLAVFSQKLKSAHCIHVTTIHFENNRSGKVS